MTCETSEPKQILLVEDDAIIALGERATIERHGFAVTCAHSGEAAIRHLESDIPVDLVLMDIDLGPGIDGVDAAARILERRTVPIVFLTSHTEKHYVERARQITNYGYVIKSSGEFVLLEAIRMAFELFDANWKAARREDELRKSEEHLDTTLHSIGDGVIVTDLEGRITRMNPVAEQLTGFPFREASGRALQEVLRIINAITGEPADNPALKAIRTGAAVEMANHTKLISRSGREYQLADSAAPVRDRRREMTGVVMVFRDFTEEYEKTRRLSESRRFLRDVFDAMQDGISVVDTEMTITSANHWMAERFGVSVAAGSLEGRKCYEAYRHRKSVCLECPVAKALETGTAHGHTTEIEESSDGRSRWAQVSAYPMHDEDGNVTGVIESVRDVTEQKQAELALEKSEEEYRALFHSIRDAILVADTERNIVNCNEAFTDLFGYELDEIRGVKTNSLYAYSEEHARMGELLRSNADRSQFLFTIHYRTKSGEVFPGETGAFFRRNEQGEVIEFIGLIRDITERRRAEKELQDALAQKDHLMKELNHRVKNNLNMVSSLLSLKQSGLGDSADLSDIRGQIDAIRIVHEKLHQGEVAGGIDLRDYLQDLLSTVFTSFATREVRLEDRIADVHVGSETAAPLGLIVNELATNAIQHGFDDELEPWFRITIEPAGDDYTLTVSNSGRPFPEEIDFENPERLGLQLVHALAAQLGGSAELSQQAPATFVVRFPAPSSIEG